MGERLQREQNEPTFFSLETVSKHQDQNSAWVVIDGGVYDVSNFLSKHPGGPEILLEHCGRDASNEFLDVGHSSDARKLMREYYIGTLHGHSPPVPDTSSSTGSISMMMIILPLALTLLSILIYYVVIF